MNTEENRKDTAELEPVLSDDNVRATVYRFDRFTIRKFRYQEITILEVSGEYSPVLGKKLERQAGPIRNNLGLDLSGVNNLQPNILSSLQRIHKRIRARNNGFLLCNPPDRLLDLLKLNGLLEDFQIASGIQDLHSASIVSMLETTEDENLLVDSAELDEIPVSKEIAHFNQSLKRTEHLEKGLDSASKCIRKILPSQAREYPDYDFSFSYSPSDKVGGNFFDFIPLGEGQLGVSIGDVSGHGLDSAIIMAMAKKIIRVRARDLAVAPPTEVLKQANRDLYDELDARIFIAALYARIDLERGLVRFTRAGHEPPLHFRAGSKHPPTFHNSTGIAVGIDSGRRFDSLVQKASIGLGRGDGILLYTDGIVESWNARKDLFSRSRLCYTLEGLQVPCTADTVIQNINMAVDRFAQEMPAEDDMTAIVIMRD